MLEPKNRKKILLLVILITILTCTFTTNFENKTISNSAAVSKRTTIHAKELIANKKDAATMKKNTTYLQKLIDETSNKGGGTVKIPTGTFYFSKQAFEHAEYYVIKCRDNVTIAGSGNSDNGTILKPVGNDDFPLDMFYYNEYANSNYTNAKYLVNADFRDFVIDGELATSYNDYNTAGKGFMINLYKDCDWYNITVKNTDGTGFGMDNPINSTIVNSTAIGCGKAAKLTDNGASGFGIGTGFSNEESITIINCKAYGNRKYGFFFEHQNRFKPSEYKATKAKSLIVVDSYAYGNMYNFGGERANDVTFRNCYSYQTSSINPLKIKNESAIHFGTSSRRTTIQNIYVDKEFNDVPKTSTYYNAVKWGLKTSIIEGGYDTSIYQPQNDCTRAQAIVMIWRLLGRPGEVVSGRNPIVETPFNDVEQKTWYIDAVEWGVNNKVLSKDAKFNPENGIKRAEYITMLWRTAGEPTANTKLKFTDIKENDYYIKALKWAVSKGIVSNTTTFGPNEIYNRGEAIKILYKYADVNGMLKVPTYSEIYVPRPTEDPEEETKTEVNKPTTPKEDDLKEEIVTEETKDNSEEKAEEESEPVEDNEETPDTEENIDYSHIENQEWTLKEIYLSNGLLNFQQDQKTFSVVVPYTITETEIIATAYDSSTKIEGLGKKELNPGLNSFFIITETKEGKVSTYELTIHRKTDIEEQLNTDNSLMKLSLNSESINLKDNIYNYEIPYNDFKQLSISALPSSDYSNISIIGNENLKVGSQIRIIVTAENGENSIYTVTIVKEKTNFFNKYKLELLIGISVLVVSILIILYIKIDTHNKRNYTN